MNQIAIPVPIAPHEIARKTSLGGAIELCVEAAGLEPKQVQSDLKLDKGQWSRWTSGQEGIVWPRLTSLMDHCGNDAPVLWMYHARGFDIARAARYETQVERENRQLREENAALRRVLQGATP
jgi:hypothetical protein